MKVKFSERAKKDFARLPKKIQKKVKQAIADYREGSPQINLKKIKTTRNLYRIAVNEWRVFIFKETYDLRHIVSIEQRKDAY